MNKIEKETGVYYAPWEKTADRIITPFEHFVHKETTSSMILIAATILALFCANSALAHFYHDFVHMKVGFTFGEFSLYKSLHHWVNDGLMTLFFFVVGLELKREIMVGELASLKKAMLPIIAAIGGMVVPALIYYAINPSGEGLKGWAIPMATDIAFAIGILVMLGNRVSRSLMAFLVALAIADDLGAVIVIALFYTESMNYDALLFAGGFAALLALLNTIGVRNALPYFGIAVGLWFAMLFSGIHPTLAGIIGALSVPARPKYDPEFFKEQQAQLLDTFEKSYRSNKLIMVNTTMKSVIYKMEELIHSVTTPLQRLEHFWHVPVAFIIIPIFAFFNAGVPINFADLGAMAENKILLGITAGLTLGKFIGITGASYIAIKLKIAQLPSNTCLAQIAGASMLAGIGFTMSIFIAQLAFGNDQQLLDIAKTGILFASLTSGIIGYVWLWHTGKERRYEEGSTPMNKDDTN